MRQQVFAAASPAGWPLWVDLVLLVGLFIATLIGTYAPRRQRVSPSTSDSWRLDLARHHPLLHGAFFAVILFFASFWIAATNHLALGSTLVVALLVGAGAGLVATFLGFILQRSQPSS